MTQAHYKCTALLVEDNQLIGELMLRRMKRLFQDCHWAQTGEEGLRLWHQVRPHIILVDQLLPGLLGHELVGAIRAVDTQVPILGITASSMGDEIEALERAGATRAISKPISVDSLKSFCTLYLEVDQPI